MKRLTIGMQWIPASCVCLALTALLAGCDRNEVKVYEVPKESSVSVSAPANSATAAPQSDLMWTLPEGWQEVPAGQMRLASFAVAGAAGKKAEVSIVPLGGVAGGELGNVNRWRGQVGLPPVTADDLAKLGEKAVAAGSDVKLFDFSGTTPAGEKARMLVTLLQREDTSWFFKMMGDDGLVAEQKPNFLAFLKSLKFVSGAETQAALPPGHPSFAAPPITAEDGQPKPQWTVPANWTEEPATQMLLAKFSAGDQDARAEITVSFFSGDVGGLPANINRWRGQLGLPPLDDAAAVQSATPIDVQSEKGSLVELNGTDAKTARPARLLGVVWPHGGQTWFFKMMGDEKVVAREKDAFIKFVQTAKLPHA